MPAGVLVSAGLNTRGLVPVEWCDILWMSCKEFMNISLFVKLAHKKLYGVWKSVGLSSKFLSLLVIFVKSSICNTRKMKWKEMKWNEKKIWQKKCEYDVKLGGEGKKNHKLMWNLL